MDRLDGCRLGRGRKMKNRIIGFKPKVNIFKPVGVSVSQLQQVELRNDELETLRLKNIEGMDIIQGAQTMGISKSTFASVYNSAVQKITVALIEGKAIFILKD